MSETWGRSDGGDAPEQARRSAPRRNPIAGLLVALVTGMVVATVLLVVLGGNPLSDANEVRYERVVVASIDEDRDRLCWSEQPGRRDAPLQCAVLALDPRSAVPAEGDRVVVGIVDLSPPDGSGVRQIVYAQATRGSGRSPSPSPVETVES